MGTVRARVKSTGMNHIHRIQRGYNGGTRHKRGLLASRNTADGAFKGRVQDADPGIEFQRSARDAGVVFVVPDRACFFGLRPHQSDGLGTWTHNPDMVAAASASVSVPYEQYREPTLGGTDCMLRGSMAQSAVSRTHTTE